MKPSELKARIKERAQAGIRRAILIEGAPGGGKTEITKQAAAELGIACRVIHAPLMQPEDYGFPVIGADRASVSFIVSAEKFPLVGTDCPEHGVLLLDEIPQSDNSGQKILANLIQAREIHGHAIKPGWTLVGTGNRTTDRSGANRILSHLGNRVTRLDLDVSIDDWTNWAIGAGIKPELIAFIRFRPELLSKFDPQSEINATPRAWADGVNESLGRVPAAAELEMFKGDVGEGPAAEFISFLRVFRTMPNPDAILLDPAKYAVPTEPAVKYALVGALAVKASAANFGRIMLYIGRMEPEFSVLFVRDALARCKDIEISPDFVKWAAGPGAKLLT
jgi:hypothetical protein